MSCRRSEAREWFPRSCAENANSTCGRSVRCRGASISRQERSFRWQGRHASCARLAEDFIAKATWRRCGSIAGQHETALSRIAGEFEARRAQQFHRPRKLAVFNPNRAFAIGPFVVADRNDTARPQNFLSRQDLAFERAGVSQNQ